MAWQVYGKYPLLCECVPLFPGPHPGVRRSRRQECLPLHTFFISSLTKAFSSGIIPFVVASVAHLVERHLAKVEVASSSLVTRSKKEGCVAKRKFCGTSFFFGIRKLFQCSPEVNSGCAKVFAPGENTCTAHPRRPALRGPMETYLFGYVSIFLVLETRYLHLNLKSEVGGPTKARGFCGYGSGFEPRHSLQIKTV